MTPRSADPPDPPDPPDPRDLRDTGRYVVGVGLLEHGPDAVGVLVHGLAAVLVTAAVFASSGSMVAASVAGGATAGLSGARGVLRSRWLLRHFESASRVEEAIRGQPSADSRGRSVAGSGYRDEALRLRRASELRQGAERASEICTSCGATRQTVSLPELDLSTVSASRVEIGLDESSLDGSDALR